MAIKFRDEHLKLAALERIATARHLYQSEERRHYSSAIYLAGVAVECILRGYRLKSDPQFSSRHDLVELLGESRLIEFVPNSKKQAVAAWLGDVWARWKNEYRFASDASLLADLKRRGLTSGVKGDQLKENARIVIESAFELINLGVARWKNE